jgi:hypothetical protein
VAEPAGVMAVRKRLMKAVFFLRDESRDLVIAKVSTSQVQDVVFTQSDWSVILPVSPAHTLELMSRNSPLTAY